MIMKPEKVMPKYDVMIIDDDIEQTKVLAMLLEYKGYKTNMVNDSTLAIPLIKQNLPKIIILDLMMPEIDGLKILKLLKESNETNKIPIIVYSGKAFDVDKKLAMNYGADAFITKPAKAQILLQKIEELAHA